MFSATALPIKALPRCRTCKKSLDNSTDRKKTRDGWWTNCQSCRDKNAAEWRHKRDTGVLKPKKLRRDANLQIPSFSADCWKRDREKTMCGSCNRRPYKPWMTGCGHIICREPCYEDLMNRAADAGHMSGICEACGGEFLAVNPLTDDDYETNRPYKRAKILNKSRSKADVAPAYVECSVCGELTSRVKLARLSACKHESDVCKECFVGWLESQLDSTCWEKVQCPSNGCDQPITHGDVKKHASAELFTRYSEAMSRTRQR